MEIGAPTALQAAEHRSASPMPKPTPATKRRAALRRLRALFAPRAVVRHADGSSTRFVTPRYRSLHGARRLLRAAFARKLDIDP